MSEILPHREYIAKFLAQQEPLIGKIEAIMTNDGKHIDLNNMDWSFSLAFEILFN